MKATIEFGGLDLTLYNRVRNPGFKNVGIIATQKYLDLTFFNQILETIYLTIDEADLYHRMSILWMERDMRKNTHLTEFKYYFGTFPGNEDLDTMDWMEVRQVGNDKRIIYVEL